MPKYKKRADGRYQQNIKIGYQDNGKPKYKSVFARTIPELERKVREYKVLLDHGVSLTDERTTLYEWADRWFIGYKSNVSASTKSMYQNAIKHIKNAPFAQLSLRKIQPADIQLWLSRLRQSGRGRTVDIIRMTLKQMFTIAVATDIVARNPLDGVKIAKVKASPKRTLTDIERHAIETADLSAMQRAFLYLGLYAGLRKSEILALTVHDIDLEKRTIRINKANVDGTLSNSTKTTAGMRTIPIPAKLHTALSDYRTTGINLFPMQNGQLMTKSSFRKFYEGIMKQLHAVSEAVSFTPHILRHTYATNLYHAGIDIKTAQKLLGHSSIVVTLDIYTHANLDHDDILAKLDGNIEQRANAK